MKEILSYFFRPKLADRNSQTPPPSPKADKKDQLILETAPKSLYLQNLTSKLFKLIVHQIAKKAHSGRACAYTYIL